MNKDKQRELVNERLQGVRVFRQVAQIKDWDKLRVILGKDIQNCLNIILGETKDIVEVAENRGAIKILKKIIASIENAESEEQKILEEYEKFK